MIAGGGLSGGISSTIAGGDFWQGMRQGLITSGLNHVLHMGLDNGYDKEGNKINDNGGDVIDIKYDDDGSIIDVRDVETRFWEKVGATSVLPLEEFGIRRLKTATGQVTSIGGAFDLFGLKEAFWNFFSGNDNVPYDFKLGVAAFKGGGKTDFNVPKGFKETKQFGYQHGQKVYQYKGKYYSYDVGSGNGLGSHNGGVWKVFEASGNKLKRIGTADENLKIFKK